LKELIINTFPNTEVARFSWYELKDRKQGYTESVEDYAYSVKKLFNRMGQDVITEKQRTRMFIEGLAYPIQEYVLRKNPTTFDEALRLAKDKEDVFRGMSISYQGRFGNLNSIQDSVHNIYSNPYVFQQFPQFNPMNSFQQTNSSNQNYVIPNVQQQ
jgi:hypothetical protein